MIFVLIAPCIIVGCGESPPSVIVKPPVDGGAMIRLPGNRGFVTIKTETPAVAKGSRKKNQPTSIVAFFFQKDGVTPMSPAPTDVVIKLGSDGNAMPVALAVDSKDPNRFTSSPGLFPQGLQGTVHLKIDGEDVEESFSAL
jgi:hypothetical protein